MSEYRDPYLHRCRVLHDHRGLCVGLMRDLEAAGDVNALEGIERATDDQIRVLNRVYAARQEAALRVREMAARP